MSTKLQYKNSQFNSSNCLSNMRLTKSTQDTSLIDDKTILHIQSEFHKILQVNPSDINEEANDIFLKLKSILNSEIYIKNLPLLVPHTVYPQIVKLLSETQDERVHLTICRIITALTNDISSSLKELLNNDLFKPIDYCISNFKFPKSTYLLFQIIVNYLSDPNEELSMFAHEKYPVDYLFRILQFLKYNLTSKIPEIDPDCSLQKKILNRWMKCIHISISRYPKDMHQNYATIVLIEFSHYFDIVFEDSLLCKHLCYTILILIDEGLLNYTDFNLDQYPNFLISLSQSVSDDETRAYALTVIGKLIQLNRYCVAFNFLEFLNIIIEANEKTSNLLLSAAVYVCNCCLGNHIIAQEVFDTIYSKIPELIEFYESQGYSIRLEMNNLFATFVKYFAEMKTDQMQQYGSAIFSITDTFFDFLPFSDNFELIFPTFEALFLLNNYLIDLDYVNSAITADYISHFADCMSELQKNEDKNISELAGKMLMSLNNKQKFT